MNAPLSTNCPVAAANASQGHLAPPAAHLQWQSSGPVALFAIPSLLSHHSVAANFIVLEGDVCSVLQCFSLLLRRPNRLEVLKLLPKNEMNMWCIGL